ncbi:MAG: hypothetical protein GY719_15520 [bacterium]|nr:hypothetical protein [bacterium]
MTSDQLSFPEPAGPSTAAIQRFHRGEDAYIRFLAKNHEGRLRPIGSMLRSDLDQCFPEIIQHLVKDSYVTINAYYKPHTHKEQDLRYLNAVYTDCDAYNLDFADAVYRILKAAEVGVIPPPTVVARSGRGIWAFWLLCSALDRNKPEKGFRENVLIYKGILTAINRRLEEFAPDLGPDPGAVDASRITRVEGSMHSGAGRRVSYAWFADDTRHAFTYTLRELSRFLDVDVPKLLSWQPAAPTSPATPTATAAKRERTHPGRARGWCAFHEKRQYELWHLIQHRGGMPEGCRQHGALVLGTDLRALHRSEEEILAKVTEYGALCRPPMPVWEIHATVKKVIGRASPLKWTGPTLARLLRVSTAEAQALELTTMHPEREPHRSRPRPRKDAREKRRALIVELAKAGYACGVKADGKTTFGGAEIRRKLKVKGLETTAPTVSRDIRDLAKAGELPTLKPGNLFGDDD